MRKILTILLTLISICISAHWNEVQKLITSDGAFEDYAGHSVSIYGNFAILGAPEDDDNGDESGSAYIFHFDGANWVEQQKLTASDGAVDKYFGTAVSIYGNYAVVGAIGDDYNGFNTGSVYIFHYDGTSWTEQQKIIASDGLESDNFGDAVSIYNEYIVVGAYGDDNNGASSGSAYIFHYDGSSWVEQQRIQANDGAANDVFGCSVSIDGNYIAVGASGDENTWRRSGSAYIFNFDGSNWVFQQKITPSDAFLDDFFGISVSISGSRVLVGSYGDDDNGGTSGSAYFYIFNGTGWVEEQKITASDGDSTDQFGNAVSLYGDYAVVAAPEDEEYGYSSGSVYIFRFNGVNWIEQNKINPADASGNDEFGYAVCIHENNIIAGAHKCDDHASHSGAAYIFYNDGVAVDENIVEYMQLDLCVYPNPFNPETNIEYTLENESPVDISIYNIKGQKIKTLVDGSVSSGYHNIVWHGDTDYGSSVSSGVYFVKMQTENQVYTKKVVLMK